MTPDSQVVCVDNSKVEHLLTVGKTYIILQPHQGYTLSDSVSVTNDKGEVGGFYRN